MATPARQGPDHDETELRAVFTKIQAHGRVLVVIDQPASIGALAIAYLPGLTMRRLADLHPGQAKTDAAMPTSSPVDRPRSPVPPPDAAAGRDRR